MRRKNKILLFLIIVILSVGLFIYGALEKAAEGGPDVYGWAWSENIGWLSFNCNNPELPEPRCVDSNYGVSLDNSTGELSGYAWAGGGIDTYSGTEGPTIGWIKMESVQLDLNSYEVSGWARACSVFQGDNCSGSLRPDSERGGWDGSIKLRGTAQDDSPYGVKLNPLTDEFEDWAWGDMVVGWLSFNCNNPETGDVCGDSNYKVFTNLAPRATNLSATQTTAEYCADGRENPPVHLNWTFQDTGGDTQNGYMIEIDEDSNFDSPRGCPLNQSPYYVDTEGTEGPDYSCVPVGLSFDTEYYWRLKVRDNKNQESSWFYPSPSAFTTYSKHPLVDFSWTPENIVIDEEVQFSDSSTCYPSCSFWEWDFENDNIIDNTEQNPIHTYTEAKDYTVKLTITDGNGKSCPGTKDLKVKMPLPTWREITPF